MSPIGNVGEADSGVPQTLLIKGGLVLDGKTPSVEAIVLSGGRVAGVGTLEDMRILAGPGAEHLDVRGCTVMPGLVDTHPHLLHFGVVSYPLADLADAKNHAEIVGRIRERATGMEPGKWVMATPIGEPHYFLRRSYRDLEERELPDRRVLDRATTDHPVMIQAWAPVIPNVCALNSAALAALGVTRETPDRVENVWIEKDGRGEPTGILRGSVNLYYTNDPFMNSLLGDLPLLDPTAALPGTRQAMSEYNQMGVTTVYEGHAMSPLEIQVYRALRAERDLFAERVGEHVLPDLIPLCRLLDAGLVVGCGTNWGPKNIFEHIQLAQTHRFCVSGRQNLGSGQPVTRREAVSMWTRDAARVLGWQDVGTLRPGSHADLIVVDRDPLNCDVDALPGTEVLRTFLGGNTVYDSGAL
jgi:predicted amidohydrolase YtcJ